MINRERPRDRYDYELAVAEECRETFKRHEIIDRSDDGREWCLRRRVNGAWDQVVAKFAPDLTTPTARN
jgi:hypothetical protein